MPSVTTLLVFAAATLALLLVPGPAVVYIVTRSVAQGRTAGLVSVAGIHAGSVVHVIAAALGLSALLAASATAFTLVKYLGAAYLVYLGLRKLLSRDHTLTTEVAPASPTRLFSEGFVVNVLNPKTAIFFLAFLPQFTDPATGPVALQVILLGVIWIVLGMASDGTYALISATLATRLRSSRKAARRLDVTSGLVYLGLGATAALTGDSAKP
ncbi:LysE family translocator [Sphaerisporangium rubeum]|uniref:Threonine/homoserine/homoserine lactone efflux protein n=1 Tax=Sphaerisporangium rubeum TaxID=321317 RepID=A0A7X0M6M7_9ACTN|nr:LysE family translocator [Sphaerisporangium rubeum]MBB6472144.1 threonine/homoserine/homoserine lactone efflux protein [Sphaerisporangium rubeum]